MAEAYIVSALRTAGGRKGGKLSEWHPVDLAAQVLNAAATSPGTDVDAERAAERSCIQAVLQGAFVLAKADGGPAIARDMASHLKRYVRLLFNGRKENRRRQS